MNQISLIILSALVGALSTLIISTYHTRFIEWRQNRLKKYRFIITLKQRTSLFIKLINEVNTQFEENNEVENPCPEFLFNSIEDIVALSNFTFSAESYEIIIKHLNKLSEIANKDVFKNIDTDKELIKDFKSLKNDFINHFDDEHINEYLDNKYRTYIVKVLLSNKRLLKKVFLNLYKKFK